MVLAEYLHAVRVHGDAAYENKQAVVDAFVSQNLEAIRTELSVPALTAAELRKSLLLGFWNAMVLSEATWEASRFAADFEAVVPPEITEEDIYARFPRPFETVRVRVSPDESWTTFEDASESTYRFPTKPERFDPETMTANLDFEEACGLYLELCNRVQGLAMRIFDTIILDAAKDLIAHHVDQFQSPYLSREVVTRLAVNTAKREILATMDTKKFVDTIAGTILGLTEFATLRPAEVQLVRMHIHDTVLLAV